MFSKFKILNIRFVRADTYQLEVEVDDKELIRITTYPSGYISIFAKELQYLSSDLSNTQLGKIHYHIIKFIKSL
jgi:hypothetical protein